MFFEDDFLQAFLMRSVSQMELAARGMALPVAALNWPAPLRNDEVNRFTKIY